MRVLLGMFAMIAGCGFHPRGEVLEEVDATDAAQASEHDRATARCPAGYEVRGTGTYRLVTEAATWNDARADCADDDDASLYERHTHLVVLAGDVESTGVRAIHAGPALWLGVSDRVTSWSWRWLTLEPIRDYPPAAGAPWEPGQPTNGDEGEQDCVVMEEDGRWDDRRCDADAEAYVCECDAYPEIAAQSDPQS